MYATLATLTLLWSTHQMSVIFFKEVIFEKELLLTYNSTPYEAI